MWVEADYIDDSQELITIGRDINPISLDEFNSKYPGAYAFNYHRSKCFSNDMDIVLVWKIWEEEDSSENLAPFATFNEADKYLKLLAG